MNEEIYKREMEEIKRNPYEYIKAYYEELYPHVGSRVMGILSLLPCSLIIPEFYDETGKKTHTRLSFLWLSRPGTAKSAISANFRNFTYESFPLEFISDAKLASVLSYKKRVTIIVSDIARIFSNPILSKQIENIIGDEGKLSRFTKRTGEEETPIDAIAYFAGTIENLSDNIREGNLFRCVPFLTLHTDEEHKEILEKVNNAIGRGKPKDFFDREKVIIDYYQKLLHIQDEIKGAELNPIGGYIIPEEFRTEIAKRTIPLLTDLFKKTDREFVREIQLVYKYMACHAFLNIFNRKVENGLLILEQDDLKIALILSKNEIKTKEMILRSLIDVSERKIRTEQELKAWVKRQYQENKPVTKDEYKLREILIKSKG